MPGTHVAMIGPISAPPPDALASALAFAISEAADCPIDTTVFLYGADLSRQMRTGVRLTPRRPEPTHRPP